jgi:hypothetical protein
MRKIQKGSGKKKDVFMGIDTHELTYRVSMFFEDEELHNSTYPSDVRHLKKLLERYEKFSVHAVYEAGPFGYTLYDWLKKQGISGYFCQNKKWRRMALRQA